MKIFKTQREIQAPALRQKYFCMMQSLIFQLHTITSAYFSVRTWDHHQTIRLFMGIKYMYSFYIVTTYDGLLDRSNPVILRFSTIRI